MHIIHYVVITSISIIFIIIGLSLNHSFNTKKHTAIYDSSNAEESKINFNISSNSAPWQRSIDDGSGTKVFNGQTYNFTIENKEKYEVNSYSIKITPKNTMYIASCWNGAIEVHQGDYVEYIEDLREYDFEHTAFKTIGSGTDRIIKLTSDDYILYYPSKSALETPVSKNQTITIGFIIYQVSGSSVDATLDMTYTMSKSLLTNPLFDLGIIGLILVVIMIIFFVILYIRVSKLLRLKEHDERMIVESIETFTGFIDAKDPYTNGHSQRVAQYTKLLVEALGYSEEDINRIYYIALLHDCGKIGIPDSILCKPERLNDEEYAVIKKHPILGADVLKNFTSIKGARKGVLYHHERYDGSGYPEGLKGEEIPDTARIICVADAVDAMNSDRCYRKKLSREKILSELKKNKGTQFDPEVCEKMISLIESGKIEL